MKKVLLVALFVAAIPAEPMADVRITTCKREDNWIYCDSRPYIKKKVPQPKRRWNRNWDR